MTHRTITSITSTVMVVGCVALSSDTAVASPDPDARSPSAANHDVATDDAATADDGVEHSDWVAPYWDMYGLISDGSMWNPEAFLALDEEKNDQVAAVQMELDIVEVVEPTNRAEDSGVVFIDPTLRAACGMAEPEVHFGVDSAEVPDTDKSELDQLSQCLERTPLKDKPLTITGAADPRGSEEYNRELGLDRADSVAEALEERGVEAPRIDTYSIGEENASDDPDDWAADRHVVISLDR